MASLAQAPPAPGGAVSGRPAPDLRVGALLPLTGPSAWFGKEMRQGLELAAREVGPATPGPGQPVPGPGAPPTPEGAGRGADGGPAPREPPEIAPGVSRGGPGPTGRASTAGPREAEAGSRGAMADLLPGASVRVALEVREVETLDRQGARERFAELAALGVAAVVTASPTPTLAVLSEAAARGVLVLHLGFWDPRLTGAAGALLQLRLPVATRAEAVVAYARDRGIRRLALLAAGSPFGQAVRAAVATAWRAAGQPLVVDAAVSLDTPDARPRLREVARAAPEAVVAGFEGLELGELVVALRQAGVAAPVLALDGDPAARLAAGPAFGPAVVVSDDFVPEPGTPGARFAESYRRAYGTAPTRHAARAYEALALLVAGLEAARAAGHPVPGGARLRGALLARRRAPALAGGDLVLRDDGVVLRPLAVHRVEGGVVSFAGYLPPGEASARAGSS